MKSRQESRSANIKKNPVSISSEIVNDAITAVKKRHYLGASNHKTNPAGGLNGYYRNIASTIYDTYRGNNGLVNPEFYIYLNSACLVYTGAGNCGELAASVYLELLSGDLTLEQKKQILFRGYKTNDAHGMNAYIQIASNVYDIWADKQYKCSRLRAQTLVAERQHFKVAEIDASRPASVIIKMKQTFLEKFAKQFDEKIQEDRQYNRIYPTLDNTDSSDFAIWASDAFQYLYTKFLETFEDFWYETHKEVAESIRKKIIRDYLFLIEELRQDIPLHPFVADLHPVRRKYSAETVSEAITTLVPNEFFAKCLLAYSYKNINPQKSLTLLSGLMACRPENAGGKLEAWLVNAVLTEFPMLHAGEADFAAALLPMLSAAKQGIFSLEVALHILSWLLPDTKRQETGPRARQIIIRSIQSEDNKLLKDAYGRHGGSPLFFAEMPQEKALEKLEQEVKESSDQVARATLKHFCLM